MPIQREAKQVTQNILYFVEQRPAIPKFSYKERLLPTPPIYQRLCAEPDKIFGLRWLYFLTPLLEETKLCIEPAELEIQLTRVGYMFENI